MEARTIEQKLKDIDKEMSLNRFQTELSLLRTCYTKEEILGILDLSKRKVQEWKY